MRRSIAGAILGGPAPTRRAGAFVLRESQRTGVAQLHAAIREFGGALLADPPGTGKTVLALAVAASYADVLVVVPAAIRAQWTRAAERAGRQLRIVTFEALSRSASPPPAALVVVDEAHHARTPGTKRHRALARLCAAADVLLLTATPVVNRPQDRDAMLALFLGTRAASLAPDALARVIVRRAPEAGLRPQVRRDVTLRGAPEVPGLADALRDLPPGFPAADGALAPTLIRISLALAWCSSLAALDAALRRRILRGAALRDALLCGRWPSRSALRAWVTTEDGSQLAFPELLSPLRHGADAGLDVPGALRQVEAHLDGVRAMRLLLAPHIARDGAARADAIRRLLGARPAERIVVFARHADTIHMLWRELRALRGVVAITGSRVHAAAGRWHRDEVLDAVGTRAGRPQAHDARGVREVRLILTTDLLAEGVEMPGVHTVLHADLAWTPARLEQRRGRLTRAGRSEHAVREAFFRLPRAAIPFVRLAERLRRKRGARREALREARARDALEQCALAWGRPGAVGPRSGTVCAAVRARHQGFLAVVTDGRSTDGSSGARTLVAGRRVRGGWRVSSAPRALLRAAREAGGTACPAPPDLIDQARAALGKAVQSRAARALVALVASPEDGRGRVPTDLRRAATLTRRLGARFATALGRAAFIDRPAVARLEAASRRALAAGVGIAVEQALRDALRSGRSDPAFLADVTAALGMTRPPAGAPGTPRTPHPVVARLEALLLLIPGAIARSAAPHSGPPSASP